MHSSILICIYKTYNADFIERAWQILDQTPGRATGAYRHIVTGVKQEVQFKGLRKCTVSFLKTFWIQER